MASALHLPATVPVAGTSFRQDAVAGVRAGDPVTITHDRDNEHDANACVVRTADGAMCGFVPRGLNERLIATGAVTWDGVVDEVVGRETRGLRVKILSAVRAEDRHAGQTPDTASDDRSGQVTSAETDAGAAVRASSGRRLGVLVRREGDKVVVLNERGVEVTYPATIVSVAA